MDDVIVGNAVVLLVVVDSAVDVVEVIVAFVINVEVFLGASVVLVFMVSKSFGPKISRIKNKHNSFLKRTFLRRLLKIKYLQSSSSSV